MDGSPDNSNRRLAVIMFTDVVGYTALMQQNEAKALQTLHINRSIHQKIIKKFNGQFLKEIGDGVLASFNSSSDAIDCAELISREVQQSNYTLRIGLHQGEVIFRDGDVYGNGVNIASRVQELAIPNSILFTQRIYDDLKNKPQFASQYLGKSKVKNVDLPVSIHALAAEDLAVPNPFSQEVSRDNKNTKWIFWTFLPLLILVILFFVFRDQIIKPTHEQLNFATQHEIPPTIAVIPFSNLSGDESKFLGFALANEVISSLTYLQNIVVRPSSSVRKYENRINDPTEIAKELDVNYILMGHYINQLDSIKLNLELIDVQQNQIQWSGSVKKGSKQIFELQEAVSQEIIKGLEVEFSRDERDRMVSDIPGNPLAYEYYLRAVAYPSDLDGYRLGIEMINKSIELDSLFAPAYNVLGDRTYRLARYALPENQNEEIEKAIQAYHHALTLNPNLMSALGNVAMVLTEKDRKDEAIELARRSIELNPNNSFARFALGYVCRYTGILDVAMEEMRKAVQLDPTNRRFRSIVVSMILGEEYEEALEFLYLEPGSPWTQAWKGFIQLKLNNPSEAGSLFREVIHQDPDGLLGIWCQGLLAYVEKTEYQKLEEFMRIQESLEDPESIFWNAVVHSLLGEIDAGVLYLKRAIEKGYYPYPYFQNDSFLDPIRNHPEFEEVMELAKTKHQAFKTRFFPG